MTQRPPAPTAQDKEQQERRQEFNRIFDSLPGKNVEKIRLVASIIGVKENTVRIYRTSTHSRTIPEFKLSVLREATSPKATDGTGAPNVERLAQQIIALRSQLSAALNKE